MSGDVEGVMALLAEDIVRIDDGGAHQRAARSPIIGRERVARFRVNLANESSRTRASSTSPSMPVPGCSSDERRTLVVFEFEFTADELVRRIFAQINPDKLGHIPRLQPPSPG